MTLTDGLTMMRGRLWRLVPSDAFMRRAAILTGAAAMGQGLVVLASPVLTRLYTPDDFGVLAVFTAAVQVLLAVAALHYEGAILVPREDETAASVLVLSLVTAASTSLVIGLVLWLYGAPLARWANVEELAPYIWLVPVAAVGGAVYRALNTWAVRHGAFREIAGTRFSQGLVLVVSQIVLGVARLGAPGLLLGAAAGQTTGSETLGLLAWRRNRDAFRGITASRLWQVALRYRSYALLGAPATLLASAGLNLPALLLAVRYGPQVVGWYALAQRVALRPLQLLGLSVGQVYLNDLSNALRTHPQALTGIFMKAILSVAVVAVPYVLLLVLLAGSLFPVIFGEEWAQSGVYVQIVGLMLLIEVVLTPVGDTFDVLHRQGLNLAREAVRTVLLALVILAATIFDLGPTAAVFLLGVASALTALGFFAIAFYAVRTLSRTAAPFHHLPAHE